MKIIKIIALIILALALGACSTATTNNAVPTVIPTVKASNIIIAQGRLEPIRYTDIALNASGLISEVLVKEGDTVSAGDVIARLKSSEAQTLEEAQAKANLRLTTEYQNLRDAQYSLDHFDVPSEFTDLTPSQAVSQTLDKLNSARAAYEPYRYSLYDTRYGNIDLSSSNAYKYATKRVNGAAVEAKKSLDDAWARYRRAIQWMELDANLKTAQTNLDQAKKEYSVLQDPAFTEDTAGVRAALANAEVRTPFSGIVTKLSLKVGEYAGAGQAVVTIADLSNWVVKTTDLTEIDVVNVKEGQPATVKLDAIPNVNLKGTVSSIGKNYVSSQ
jgi:multidrug efflux pump subunit AcrA (membrane-fusion protein)